MRVIELSISEREAEDLYPTQYWDGTRVKKILDLDTDALQDAYMRGREAEPCEEQVEAVAKYLADTSDGWNTLTEADREQFRETAAEILQVARKAVM